MSNTSRIAKNTLLLYFRMFLIMAVGLYTSRIILAALGVEDFGIYNVVGGVVALFGVLSGSLTSAISRFITYELGKVEEGENKSRLNKIFCSSITIQIILSIIILLIAESVGLWFLNTRMTIPDNRLEIANWVFQISLITFFINLISIPYNASIIAHEKMSAFAYISVVEALGKLAIAFTIEQTTSDRLLLYAALIALLSLIVRLCYVWYCHLRFEECRFRWLFDRGLIKQMFSFAGWNFIGVSSSLLRDQGGNVLINLFYGPTVNAAQGIANQVSTAVLGFVDNFMMAVNPQITKSYANKDYDYMFSLMFKGAKLSFFLLLLLSLPILLNTKFILTIWLKEVPEHTILFVQLILIFILSECISKPLITAMLATGNIRDYQILVGGLQMMNLPVSYVALKMGAAPECVMIISIIISQCCLMARLYMLRILIKLDVKEYLNKVYLKVIVVTILGTTLPLCASYYMKEGWESFFIVSTLSVVCVLSASLFVGCTTSERAFLLKKIEERIGRK